MAIKSPTRGGRYAPSASRGEPRRNDGRVWWFAAARRRRALARHRGV